MRVLSRSKTTPRIFLSGSLFQFQTYVSDRRSANRSRRLWKINVIANEDPNFEPVHVEDPVIISRTSNRLLETKQMHFRLSSDDFSVLTNDRAIKIDSAPDTFVESSSDNHNTVLLSDGL